MQAITNVYLFGSLSAEGKGNGAHPIPHPLPAPVSLSELLNSLGIASERVQLAMVNHRAVPRAHVIHPGDRIALFPKEYAIFADWKNFRN